jgi:hypothetical protein
MLKDGAFNGDDYNFELAFKRPYRGNEFKPLHSLAVFKYVIGLGSDTIKVILYRIS